MRRWRLLRFLLPGLLLLALVLFGLQIRPRRGAHTAPPAGEEQTLPRAEDISFVVFDGQLRKLAVKARRVLDEGEGRFRLEQVERLEIDRERGTPLLVSAAEGVVEGAQDARRMRFDSEVVLRDEGEGLELRLPTLEVDEAAGEARSQGDVRFSAPGARGRASALIYGLRSQPTRLESLALEDDAGGQVDAQHAELIEGLSRVQLSGAVRVQRAGDRIESGRMLLVRGPDGRLASVEASEGTAGELRASATASATFRARQLQAGWDESGRPAWARFDGEVGLGRGETQLTAAQVSARRGANDRWEAAAQGAVRVEGRFGGEPARLESDSLQATLDDRLELIAGEARGEVRFEGTTTRGEAERATLERGRDGESIRLFGEGTRKARLAKGTSRVAADRVTTDARGTRLAAEGAVEATLLPAVGAPARPLGPFRAEEAVHFVAARMDSESSTERIVFEGSVRGWQGERNLAAGRVQLEQQRETLSAERDVTTRLPRVGAHAASSEADYVQIAADRLDYSGSSRRARYSGHVRVRLAEGWLEAEQLDVDLTAEGGALREARASGDVRLEFREATKAGVPQPVSGRADRATYDPGKQQVWLYGDAAPASVRRMGKAGGTTAGRVLRYDLGLGQLEVDSGGQGPARIRTQG
ncbi:MAG TPA: LptA/OstA family protein [Candidatus Polarisedimenticolaceae bacterium]|nr:LptA/OstA family protein [Candidatus Polarisedimenticolaceae bacterium]